MTEKKRIRVMIADDDKQIRQMLEALIEVTEDMELVAQAAHGAEAVRDCVLYQPDIALIDSHMPLMDGLEAVRTIRRLVPQTRVIVYSDNDTPRLPNLIWQAGAAGCLEKTAPIATLLRTIRNTHVGLTSDGKRPLEEQVSFG